MPLAHGVPIHFRHLVFVTIKRAHLRNNDNNNTTTNSSSNNNNSSSNTHNNDYPGKSGHIKPGTPVFSLCHH